MYLVIMRLLNHCVRAGDQCTDIDDIHTPKTPTGDRRLHIGYGVSTKIKPQTQVFAA